MSNINKNTKITKKEYPVSKKMEEIINIAENIDDSQTYILCSDEQSEILSKKTNKKKLRDIINNEFRLFFKRHNITDQLFLNKQLEIYRKELKERRKNIDKTEEEQKKKLKQIIIKALKSYKKKTLTKQKDLLLFVPSLDQPFETEYDFNLYFDKTILNEKNKKDFINILFFYDQEISLKELSFVEYINNNIIIEEYSNLINLEKEIKSKKIKKYIKVEDQYKLFKEEIFLAKLFINNDTQKLSELLNNLYKNFFKKNKYTKNYKTLDWYIIEEFYKKDEYNNVGFLSKKYIDLFKNNKKLKYYVSKNNNNIIIREEYRKDVLYIKGILQNILYNMGLQELIENTQLKDFDYINIKGNDGKQITEKKERIFQIK